MEAKAVYTRLQPELYNKVKAFSAKTNQSMSSTIENLLDVGLKETGIKLQAETLEKEIAGLREKYQKSETDKASALGQLEACKMRESIAMAAQSHAAALQQETDAQKQRISQLTNYLSTYVATCLTCHTQLTLLDVGQRRCPNCGDRKPELLPEFKAPQTPWEIIREPLAVTGATAIVVALLNALENTQQQGKT
ncbi:MAG: hypothetical protein C4542_00765 [Dehalococcoidia bacterium]|nr:MAG: hypothetical protein C4542_00765 [Dehalococcoidia bacterium]